VRILLDANILVHLANSADPNRQPAINALGRLAADGHEAVLVPQVLYEFWVVATRPTENNGLGMAANDADADVSGYVSRFFLVEDSAAIFEKWREVVTKYAIVGKHAHDARLVAAMASHSITHLLTFNDRDFRRYSEVTIVMPAHAASFPPAIG
jgi:predicted nucleic acid-binding protein